MKTRKILALLLISLLVFTVTPMSAFAADEITSVTVDANSGTIDSNTKYGTVNGVLAKGGTQILETELTISSSNTQQAYFTPGSSSNEKYYMFYYAGEELLIGTTDVKDPSKAAVHGTVTKILGTPIKYHVLCVMNVPTTVGDGTMDVYINGEQVATNVTVDLTNSSNAFWKFIFKSTNPASVTLSTVPEGFDAAQYAASAAAKADATNITVSRNTQSVLDRSGFKIALGERTEKVTKKALLDSLTVSNGATVVLYGADAVTELGTNDYVESGSVLKITSENGKVINKYDVSVTYKWPAVPYTLTLDNSSGTSTMWRTLSYSPAKGDVVVIEYNCIAPATNKTSHFVELDIDGASKYWYPVEFNNGTLIGNVRNGRVEDEGGADRKHIGYYTEGEKFHVVSVLRFDDNTDITASSGTKTTARLFINGVEVITEGPVGVNYSDVYNKCGVSSGNTATVTMYSGMSSVADFDYSQYMANASVKAETKGIYVTGDSYKGAVYKNAGITVGDSNITTVEGLLNALNVNGTASVYATASAETAMLNTAALATGNVLKVTSANEKVSNSYSITVADEDAITFTEDTKGNIIASVIPSDLSNTLFLAGYSEAGELKALEIVRNGAMADSTFVKSDTLQAGLTASEASGCQVIRAFYWTSEMNPIDAEVYVNN